MHAAAKGRVDTLRVLLAGGADVNRATPKGFTPLFFALKSGVPAAAMAVLDAGGDPDHVGPDGTTAVQLAMYQQDWAFAARMIERGADLAARDLNGRTLLHAAVLADRPELVKLLLARGAAVDAPTGRPKIEWRFESNFKTGEVEFPPKTALFLAAEKGRAALIPLLTAAGANRGFRLADGTGIIEAAKASGSEAALQAATTCCAR
jgi:ankyrin repeat protein